jgi:hypothetical protein
MLNSQNVSGIVQIAKSVPQTIPELNDMQEELRIQHIVVYS